MESNQQRCETCFEGKNTRILIDDELVWSRCDACNARALNGAQLRDIQILQENEGLALIGACLGSRKTGTTVGFINRNRGVWVGVVPIGTMKQWKAAIHEWSPGTRVHLITTKNKTGLVDLKQSGNDDVHLIGWELMRRQDWKQFDNLDGAFLDEVHRMAGYETQTSKALHNRLNTRFRIGLSGTPANNRLHQLWNVLHWIWWGNNDHKSAYRLLRYKVRNEFADGTPGWLPRHFRLEKQFSKGIELPPKVGLPYNVRSIVEEIPCYIQHLEDETCCEFHPGGVNATLPGKEDTRYVFADMTPAQKKIYDRLASGSSVFYVDDEEGQQQGIFLSDEKVRRLRKRQVTLAVPSLGTDDTGRTVLSMKFDAASSVADAWLDLAEDIVEPGDPVLVVTHSKIFAKMLVERTNKRFKGRWQAAEWTGDTDQAERDHLKDVTFGRPGGPQVIVASTAAIAEGIDGLQHVCRREVVVSWDENDTLNKQFDGRLNRTGQKRRVQRWEILVTDSDEAKIVKQKLKNRALLEAGLRATV